MATPKEHTQLVRHVISVPLTTKGTHPVAYANDVWDEAKQGSSLAAKMNATGYFSQADINEILAAHLASLLEQIQTIISYAVDIRIVDSLPETNISTTTIYFVPKEEAQTNNIYSEYVYTTDDGWEKIGETEIDLSGYVQKEQGAGLMPDAQKEWVAAKMRAELYDEAMSKFSVATSGSASYVADEADGTTLTVKVTLTFDGTAVDADSEPNGWSKTPNKTGEYTKSVSGASGTISAQSFSYTPSSGKYNGIGLTKSSEEKSIAVIYPIWYGFIDSGNANDFANKFASLTRKADGDYSHTGKFTNTANKTAWFWALTHNTASAVDKFTGEMFSSAVSKTVSSSGYTLENYKLYITKKNAPAGDDLSGDCTVTIKR